MERACTEYRISIYTRKRGVERPEWSCRTIRKCCTGCITTVFFAVVGRWAPTK